MGGLKLIPHVSHAVLLEALEVIRAARARVTELGFEASTVDVHGVPRALFDQLPGMEERGQYGSYEPYWSKIMGGVNVYCDEPPVSPVQPGQDGSHPRYRTLRRDVRLRR